MSIILEKRRLKSCGYAAPQALKNAVTTHYDFVGFRCAVVSRPLPKTGKDVMRIGLNPPYCRSEGSYPITHSRQATHLQKAGQDDCDRPALSQITHVRVLFRRYAPMPKSTKEYTLEKRPRVGRNHLLRHSAVKNRLVVNGALQRVTYR